jgi:hypothetical protein
MNVEQSLEWELTGKTEVLGENLPQCHFVHHKSHMTWSGLEPWPQADTNRLSYGTANVAGCSNIIIWLQAYDYVHLLVYVSYVCMYHCTCVWTWISVCKPIAIRCMDRTISTLQVVNPKQGPSTDSCEMSDWNESHCVNSDNNGLPNPRH